MRMPLGVAALLVLRTATAAAQSWDHYVPATFRQVIQRDSQALSAIPDDGAAAHAFARGLTIRAELNFSGRTRPIAPDTREFVARWFRTRGWDAAEAEIFTEEWLFREEDTEHWVPVQTETAASMRPAVSPGEAVTLYAVLIGALRPQRGATWRWVFILSAAASD